jgi:hypothetical protein
MKQPKEQRFQMFLHEMHEPTTASAAKNGRTLSSEVRHRVKASFALDSLREWLNTEIPNARGDRLSALIEVGDRLFGDS